jgi:hypothetical protein
MDRGETGFIGAGGGGESEQSGGYGQKDLHHLATYRHWLRKQKSPPLWISG